MDEVNKVTEIKDIPVYQDIYMDDDKFIIIYKGKPEIEPGLVFIPWVDLSESTGATIDNDEVNRILKMKKDKNLKDVSGIVCKEINETIIENIRKILEEQFK